ncbi:TonB-dependent receptor [Sphingobium phenoxybenzoativorans]|uniref:TonB-dependent receptor n=1 Tax=Sphingobium phenoxybenzoativorans TaxID=1592790 RepID=A0A975K947_9SPHN|nr:TonB-dependent receptor [Sphingobium phenoxybenzoativorans]QUT07040.1 TonB-dependent receptor [Sphingobium phenoxybenzoativorans]
MSHSKLSLLAAVATIALIPSAFPTLALAQDVAPAAADASADSGDDIIVLGFGEVRQVQTIGKDDIALLTPGTTPLKAISKLPGVNFQSADAFGAYEWSSRISLRGFNQNQLGFTLDGVPLGDMSYGNYNGLHVSRAIISENLGTVAVSQGAGSLSTASISNLGGTLQFTSRDPSADMDIVASGTYGSDETMRGFVRVESGDMGGVRGYASYGYLKADKWKGVGKQEQHQANAKIVADIGDGKITGFVNFSDRRENDYQDMSAAMIQRLGSNWDNISGDWATAYRLAAIYQNQNAGTADPAFLPYPTYGTTFPAPFETVDDAYFDAAGLRRDWLTGLTFETPVTSSVRFKLQGYYHNNHGQGLWWTPYVASPTGAPLSIRTTEYDMDRMGTLANVTWEMGANTLEVGGWFENNDFHQARRFYSLANTLGGSSRDSTKFQTNPFATQWEFKYSTETVQYYVSDKIDLGSLTLSGGWKGVRVRNTANPIVKGGLASGKIESKDWFLPQVGALFRVNDNAELFANYTENFRPFVSAATSGLFGVSQASFNASATNLKPETSKTIEGGARIRAGSFQGSLAAYYVDFKDRILSVQVGSPIEGRPSELQNVGSVRSYGFEAAGTFTLMHGLSATASYAYNDSTYRDDVLNGVTVVPLKGKTVVDSPKHIASGEIAYDGEMFFGRIGANYMSKRYYTYLNDQSVKSRVLVDASIGIKVPEGMGFLTGFAIEASATNLFDKEYVSTVGSGGFSNSGDGQTLLPGAPQQFFVTLRRGF